MRYNYPDALTLLEVVRRGKRVSNNGKMLGYRCKQADGSEPYVWMRYSEVFLSSKSKVDVTSILKYRNFFIKFFSC